MDDVDLYAEDGTFEGTENINEEKDETSILFDEILTAKGEGSPIPEVSEEAPKIEDKQQTRTLLVGGLSPFVNDDHLRAAILSIGIKVVHDITFYESRYNGQSKGYCQVTLNRGWDYDYVMKNLGKVDIKGSKPLVLALTKSNENYFEEQAPEVSKRNEQKQEDYNKLMLELDGATRVEYSRSLVEEGCGRTRDALHRIEVLIYHISNSPVANHPHFLALEQFLENWRLQLRNRAFGDSRPHERRDRRSYDRERRSRSSDYTPRRSDARSFREPYRHDDRREAASYPRYL